MKDIKELFSVATGVGYDWAEFHVYAHPTVPRKYVTWFDSGCSCNMYYHPSLKELSAETPEGKREVYAAFSQWWDSQYHDGCDGTKIDNLERLRASL